MTIDPHCPMPQHDVLRQVTGNTIRPGGLALTERALAVCGLPAGARALDVGCGTGGTLEQLAIAHGFAAVGCDLSATRLREGRRRVPTLAMVQAPAECLPIAGESVDVILAECTLSVTGMQEQLLAECLRVLRAEGFLIVSDLYARNPASDPALRQAARGSCFGGLCSKTQIADSLEAKGFRMILWEDHSQALKDLAVQLILTNGSLEPFWCSASAGFAGADVQKMVARSRPGYFLLIARKRHE
jgi:ubiquinone/menaquinone biosynthesis C-methylase UbiE